MPLPSVGAPAEPKHSRTVTLADPPVAVIVLTTVTSQIRPRPGVSSTPLLHVVVGAIVAAAAGEVVIRVAGTRSARAARHRKKLVRSGRIRTPAMGLSLIHISEPTRLGMISYA